MIVTPRLAFVSTYLINYLATGGSVINAKIISLTVFAWCILVAMTVGAEAQSKAAVKSITVYQDPG